MNDWMAVGYESVRQHQRLPRGRNLLKSYLVEANVLEDEAGHADVTTFFATSETAIEVRETDDPTLHRILVGGAGVEFFLDSIDPRFWVMHTQAGADAADAAIRAMVQRTRCLDSFWFPTHQLEEWSGQVGVPRMLTAKFALPTGPLQDDLPEEEYVDDSLLFRIGAVGDARERWRRYRQAEELAPSLAVWHVRIARREPDRDAVVMDDVSASGKVTSRGTSFRLHEELVHGLRNRYAALISGWEETYRLRWIEGQVGVRPEGRSAVLRLPVPLTKDGLTTLVSNLFTCGEPYRLYGAPVPQGEERYVVRGVDLHTGDKIDFEIVPDFVRAYLYPTTCGNVLARLLTNLQHFHDARVELE